MALLVDQGVLAKRRGVGMFVEQGARELILTLRKEAFAASYLVPLVDEAAKLGMNRTQLKNLMDKVAESRGLYE